LSTPTINLRRAGRPAQAGAQRKNDDQAWRPVDQTGPGEEGDLGPIGMQTSNLSRFRVLRGLVWLDDIVPLPQTLRGYLFFVLALTLVCGLAVIQVWTSLRITQARAELELLRVQYSLIEQKNAELLWQIGQRTTLEQVQLRAVQLDFRPALQRNYIPNPYSLRTAPAASAGSGASGGSRQSHRQAENSPALEQPPAVAGEQTAISAGNTGSLAAAQERRALGASPPDHARTLLPSSDEPSSWSVTERLPVAEFEQYVSGWKQQINDSWQTVRQWSEPLLERAGDFFLGQLKRPR
jgi:hypothetical protein